MDDVTKRRLGIGTEPSTGTPGDAVDRLWEHVAARLAATLTDPEQHTQAECDVLRLLAAAAGLAHGSDPAARAAYEALADALDAAWGRR